MKFWLIIVIIVFVIGAFLNTIKDMRRSTDAYAKRRAKELAEFDAKAKANQDDDNSSSKE
ncbi:hypothetical protein [Celerinatantimonas diazotrophica]|uniref:DUF2897 family protein n=1 Tax=Celerinatantimonas diazotrophica TaxID=412034 RepID=A0A4R1K536_9GAMM|nr:hypothetical protein [Celerinatantimonas diazotrophica]TCK59057.1 hypothetical protein EV690_1221 [Celerinatantimonas diazotrophica]CAG9297692.1 hypothetical protein CEDIAZO_02881 [Celerinatantimonas diazotrophica]